MAKKTVLVTGSCGFIFSNFIRKAIYHKLNFNWVSIDKVTQTKGLSNIYANKSHDFYLGDVADSHFIDRVFELEKPDIIIHGAAESHVDESIKNVLPFIHSNVLGTQVLLNAAVKHSVERFILMSTDEVLGALSLNDVAWTENSPLQPRNPYSASKASSELLVQATHATYGLPYNIIRSCNNFGPRQSTRNLIPVVIKCILNNQPIPIYGQGQQVREWIYVEDTYHALMTVLNQGQANEIYNVSTGYELSNLELAQKICNLLEKGHNLITHIPDPRPGHDFRYALDSTKLKQLGWVPTVKFKHGLSETIRWYSNNQWFLKS